MEVKVKRPVWKPINDRLLVQQVNPFDNLEKKGIITPYQISPKLIIVAKDPKIPIDIEIGDEVQPLMTEIETDKGRKIIAAVYPTIYDENDTAYLVLHYMEIFAVKKPTQFTVIVE